MLLRLLVKPRWLLRHLIVIGLCVGFFFLSRWQFHRGEATTGTVQNYGYSVEWLAFGGCVCFGWWRMLQDELHPEGRKRNARSSARGPRVNPWQSPPAVQELTRVPAPSTQEANPVAAPRQGPILHGLGELPVALVQRRKPEELTTAMIDPDDEEVVRYNAWLAELNANPGRRR